MIKDQYGRKKILFFAEGATLAHVARSLVLARSLDPAKFDVVFARPKNYEWLTKNESFKIVDLSCQDSNEFSRRLERGLPLYDYPTLKSYVQDDLSLIDFVCPNVTIGDFRLSLSVSSRVRRIPFINLCDAYWSPEHSVKSVMPVLSLTRYLPIRFAELCFRMFSPLVFRIHAIPHERLRSEYGLPSLGHDLKKCYTDADFRLFANIPALFPDVEESERCAFIGPIAWSPENHADFALSADLSRDYFYVSMGSSGDTDILFEILMALAKLGPQVIVSTAARWRWPDGSLPSNVKVFDFVPGDFVCKAARLVVCNGGSPTTNQALVNGVPVLGVAKNMDQFMNMRAIEKFGAGLTMRADRVTRETVLDLANQLWTKDSYRINALKLAQSAKQCLNSRSLEWYLAKLSN